MHALFLGFDRAEHTARATVSKSSFVHILVATRYFVVLGQVVLAPPPTGAPELREPPPRSLALLGSLALRSAVLGVFPAALVTAIA